jgi:hypothetical protein
MQTTYEIHTDDLDDRFTASIKAAFPHRKVTIAVLDQPDETDYLLSDPERKARLLQAIEDIQQGRSLVVPDQKLFS